LYTKEKYIFPNKKEGTNMKQSYQMDTISVPSALDAKKKVEEFLRALPLNPASLCPVKDVLHTVADKWSMLVMMVLGTKETMRFTELKTAIRGISQKMLTATLRDLESYGLVSRRVYAQIPPKVEYTITPIGTAFLQHLVVMLDWACGSMQELKRQRKKAEKTEQLP
jgi:DNA-binding HxlR family transcriptional regulator